MDIDESFYRNVFLLMQVVPASYDCAKYFVKGMFNKPNTAGFIHLSHYLLSIHNEKRFKKMVIWPIWGKADETRYRSELKEYIELLSIENPDVCFPVVLKSHLIQAGGVKLLILMWKISQIALRAYIERTYSTELLNFPIAGGIESITERYFLVLNKKGRDAINKLHDEERLILETFKRYVKCKSDELEKTQTAIFQVQENVEKITSTLPVDPLVAKRLRDVDDTEIINIWKENVVQNIKYLNHENLKLKRLKDMTEKCSDIIMDFCVNNKVLDGNDLPKISYETLSCFNVQHDCNGLYKNGCLVLQALLTIFDQAFKQTERNLRKTDMIDLTKWESEISEQCKTLKCIEEAFRKLVEQVSDQLRDFQDPNLSEEIKNYPFDTSSVCPASLRSILISPKYDLSSTEDVDEKIISERMLVSPIKGKYDHLFKRYKYDLLNKPKISSVFQFNDSIDSILSSFRSPQRRSIDQRRSNELAAKYSRLFSPTKSKRNYFKDNNAASTPNRSPRTSSGIKSDQSGRQREINRG